MSRNQKPKSVKQRKLLRSLALSNAHNNIYVCVWVCVCVCMLCAVSCKCKHTHTRAVCLALICHAEFSNTRAQAKPVLIKSKIFKAKSYKCAFQIHFSNTIHIGKLNAERITIEYNPKRFNKLQSSSRTSPLSRSLLPYKSHAKYANIQLDENAEAKDKSAGWYNHVRHWALSGMST